MVVDFRVYLVTVNFCLQQWKNYYNRRVFAKVMLKWKGPVFLTHSVYCIVRVTYWIIYCVVIYVIYCCSWFYDNMYRISRLLLRLQIELEAIYHLNPALTPSSVIAQVNITSLLSVPRTQLSTYGDRAFPVATVRIWNSLPQHITSAPSLPVFCSRLKTYFFELCYP